MKQGSQGVTRVGGSGVHQVKVDSVLVLVLILQPLNKRNRAHPSLPGACGPLRVFKKDFLLLKEPLMVGKLGGMRSRVFQGGTSRDSDLVMSGSARHRNDSTPLPALWEDGSTQGHWSLSLQPLS